MSNLRVALQCRRFWSGQHSDVPLPSGTPVQGQHVSRKAATAPVQRSKCRWGATEERSERLVEGLRRPVSCFLGDLVYAHTLGSEPTSGAFKSQTDAEAAQGLTKFLNAKPAHLNGGISEPGSNLRRCSARDTQVPGEDFLQESRQIRPDSLRLDAHIAEISCRGVHFDQY